MTDILLTITPHLSELTQLIGSALIVIGGVLAIINREKIVLKDIFKKKTQVDKELLLKHDLFSLYASTQSHIDKITLGNDDTSKVYKIIITNKHEAMARNLESLIKNPDVYTATKSQLHGMIVNAIVETYNDYDSKNLRDLGQDLYDLIVAHPKFGFNTIHEKVLQNVFLNIKDMILDVNKLNLTNAEILVMTLDLSKNALNVAVDDTKDMFINFNGNLSSLITKQRKINPNFLS